MATQQSIFHRASPSATFISLQTIIILASCGILIAGIFHAYDCLGSVLSQVLSQILGGLK
jgi:hypothetical protein